MIEFVRGRLTSRLPSQVVIEWNGLGLGVIVPLSTLRELGEPGPEITLLTHLHWREEGPQLFGFLREEERTLFRMLTKVDKIGPKLAINILSAASPEKLVEMILTEDLRGLTALKGVGSKIASRLVLELKESVAELGFPSTDVSSRPKVSGSALVPCEKDARAALESLGYTTREIDKALREVVGQLPPDATLETVIEFVLRSFSS